MRKAVKPAAGRRKTYKILTIDPYLAPYQQDIQLRMERYNQTRMAILGERASLPDFANGYLYYGFHRTRDGWVYREWAPHARALHLIGDFNHWNRESHPLRPMGNGAWEISLPGKNALPHLSLVKVQVTEASGQVRDRIPLYIRRVVQDPNTRGFNGQIWARPAYPWTDADFSCSKCKPLFIYECHVGMAQEKEGIGSYQEFADNVLPRVKRAGYNAIQLMAIQEHPYYASFGYQVSNFFAASSWYGTPDDLKYLINTAHQMGIAVLLDLVHSHYCKNTAEGIEAFDGDPAQFSYADERGDHPAWGSRLFHYGKHEVIHFLLSNIKFWMEEYHFDGFRFDGVTSMLYWNHGLGMNFDGYDKYFSLNTNTEAVTYLQLATELIHAVNPHAITIAEDMSGMPGMCLPVRSGGIGFDYRLTMGVPDFWIKTLKERTDEQWDLGKMWYELTTRRPQEKCIGYVESHDQALVGDKTLIFRLADAEMYTGMDKACQSPVLDRAIALHKLIRFITLALAGDGYLNFMGNEFGHPEWIDFPREGNGWSYQYARRQWSLSENGYLKYEWLGNFDRAMIKFAKKYRLLSKKTLYNLWMDDKKKILAFNKGGLIFVFNFHPSDAAEDFFVPAHIEGAGDYQAIFSSDEPEFGGHARIELGALHSASAVEKRGIGFLITLPNRTAVVLKKV